VNTRPSTPVARRTLEAVVNALRKISRPEPDRPERWASVPAIAARTAGGANAATTMTAGKNDTNALAASAMPRSMNSFSSMRSQTRQKIVRSARPRTSAASLMTWPARSRAPVTHGGDFIRPPPRIRHRRQLRPARDQGVTTKATQPPPFRAWPQSGRRCRPDWSGPPNAPGPGAASGWAGRPALTGRPALAGGRGPPVRTMTSLPDAAM